VALLAEAARILRPGGILLSVEYSWFPQTDLPNGAPWHVHMPAFSCLFHKLADCFHPTGLHTRAEEVATRIGNLGIFKDDISIVHTVRMLVSSVFVSDADDAYAGANRTSPARGRPRRAWG
jgi:hypothetical protein